MSIRGGERLKEVIRDFLYALMLVLLTPLIIAVFLLYLAYYAFIIVIVFPIAVITGMLKGDKDDG